MALERNYLCGMADFFAVIFQVVFEYLFIGTGRLLLSIFSLGRVTTSKPAHPPAYGVKRPIVVGQLAAFLVGLAAWLIVGTLAIAILHR